MTIGIIIVCGLIVVAIGDILARAVDVSTPVGILIVTFTVGLGGGLGAGLRAPSKR